MRACPGCGDVGVVKFAEKIDHAKLTADSFSSRKRPELLHHEYLECRGCKSLFVRSVPSQSELGQKYEAATFISEVESASAARTYVGLVEKMKVLPDSNVLDLGCADGAFLLELHRHGVRNLAGVEPSIESIAAADEAVRHLIVQGGLEALVAGTTYRLVTCFQTIEHVSDPEDFIGSVRERVSEGGYFAIACHNRRSMVNKLLGQRSPIFDIEHMQLFTPSGIRALFERNGFSDVRVKAYANTYPLFYWISLAPVPRVIKDFVDKRRQWRLFRTPITFPVGNLLVVGRKANRSA